MILRRLASALKRQDWFQVIIEILIVVIGIFLGLQVQALYTERENRVLEADYLSRLHQVIQSDIEKFDELESWFEIKKNMAISLRDQPIDILLQRDPKVLMYELRRSATVALPRILSATFEELASTGKLSLIQDVKLRDELSEYYIGYQHISVILSEPIGDYRKILYEALPGELTYDWQFSNEINDLDGLKTGLEILSNDPRLPPAANVAINYATSLIFSLRDYRGRAQQLLKQIETKISVPEELEPAAD